MDERPLVVVTNRTFPETRDLLESCARVVANPAGEPWSYAEVTARCRDADGVMAFMTDRIDDRMIEACTRLKVIGAALKGYDNIDVAAATHAGVWVTIVPDLLTTPTAELAVGLVLSLTRQIRRGDSRIRRSGFAGWRPDLYGVGLTGSVVGIVGFGRVGQAIAHCLSGFQCRVLAFDRGAVTMPDIEVVSLSQLLATADIVVLALPLTDDTVRIISAAALALMKPGAMLVNPARGSLVDESAVADALDSGHLGGYAADVFACEDWARSARPHGIDPRLTADDAATVLTPHIGSAVALVRRDIELSAARSILEALNGQIPDGAVNTPRR